VDLAVEAGEIVGLVGESGSGKSVTALAVLGLVDAPGRVHARRLAFDGRDLAALSPRARRDLLGGEIAMIFQDPMTSLNPLQRIGEQIGEMIGAHERAPRATLRSRAIELLRQVGIPNPEARVDDYPHQFSGGMRQRAMIALALACSPALLIADEPTTALDVTTQKQILTLLAGLIARSNMAVILITHDLGVVAEVADRVLVMYAGQCVEAGTAREIFYDPQHPYTAGLIASIPAADRPRQPRLASIRGAPPVLTRAQEPGCPFRPRCEHAFARCTQMPPLAQRVQSEGHVDRCWLTPAEKAVRLQRPTARAVH
jgi:oligopeptide/dipeptide ABC transporter ATP-binding protein